MLGSEWLQELPVVLGLICFFYLLWNIVTRGIPYTFTHWTGSSIAPPSFSFAWPFQAMLQVDKEFGFFDLRKRRDPGGEVYKLPCAFRLIRTVGASFSASTTLCFNPTLHRLIRDYPSWRSQEATDHIEQVIQRGPDNSKYIDMFPTESLAIGIYRQGQSYLTSNSFQWKSYLICLIFAILECLVASYEHSHSGDWIILAVTYGGIILSCSHSSVLRWLKRQVPPKKLQEDDYDQIAFINTEEQANTPILILGDQGDLNLGTMARSTSSIQTPLSKFISIFFAICWSIWLVGVYLQFKRCPLEMTIMVILGFINTELVDRIPITPEQLGIPLEYVGVIGAPNSIDAIIELEKRYPFAGVNFVDQFKWQYPFEKKNMYAERFSPLDAPEEITELYKKVKSLRNHPNRLAEIQILEQNRVFPNTVSVLYAKSKST